MEEYGGGMGDDAANRGDGPEEYLPGEPLPADYLPAAVERWELSGGTWRVQSLTGGHALVELLRCDGGEIADLTTLTDPHDLHWARAMLADEAHSAVASTADTVAPTRTQSPTRPHTRGAQ